VRKIISTGPGPAVCGFSGMTRTSDDNTRYGLEPSPFVRRFAKRIADAATGRPLIDVACGSGRNAITFAQLGCTVICVDRDLGALQDQLEHLRCTELRNALARLSLHQLDLVKDRWPFAAYRAGGIINVHFLLPALFPLFERSLSPGGYILLETVPGCGGNYLELPKAGELRSAFERGFDLEFYRERKVGPPGFDTVTARVLARKRSSSSRRAK
jgi:tellurite methyltransferase